MYSDNTDKGSRSRMLTRTTKRNVFLLFVLASLALVIGVLAPTFAATITKAHAASSSNFKTAAFSSTRATAMSITEYASSVIGSNPFTIAQGPSNTLWFTEGGSNKIGRITNGSNIASFTVPTAKSTPPLLQKARTTLCGLRNRRATKLGAFLPQEPSPNFPFRQRIVPL